MDTHAPVIQWKPPRSTASYGATVRLSPFTVRLTNTSPWPLTLHSPGLEASASVTKHTPNGTAWPFHSCGGEQDVAPESTACVPATLRSLPLDNAAAQWQCTFPMSIPSRDQALSLLREHLHGNYVLRHSFATEAVMRALAVKFNADAELWSLTGLLHDLDLELVGDDMNRHARETVRILRERFDYPQEGLDAILAHNGDVLDIPCRTPFEHAVTAGESITGMAFAAALVIPSKKLVDVKPSSVAKRIKEPRFAAKVSRERIGHHRDLGLDAQEFCALAVEAMKSIASELDAVEGV